jgi:uncharacterized protein (UPF0548 family)
MFKIGELVTTLHSKRTGLVLETKGAYLMQYCRVLFVNEEKPRWFVYTSLKEKE